MTDASDFLAAIIDRPDDDLPCLVFADYLDEAGEGERAEFIRVQCELARLPVGHPDQSLLALREMELRTAHKRQWKIPGLRATRQEFRRGFVEQIEITAEQLLAAKDIFERTPVRDLRIANADDFIDVLVHLPGLARIESLNLRANHLGGGDRLYRLFAEGRFDRLRWLNLQNNRLWPESFEPFTRLPVAAQLTGLHVSGNPLADEGTAILAAGFPNLTELVFRGDAQPYSDSMHADGAEALARSRTLTKLRVLNLARHYIGDSGLIKLVNSPNAGALVELDVSYNTIGETGERGIEELVGSPHLGNLRLLKLVGNELSLLAVRELLRWPRLREGVRVDLTDVNLSVVEREMIVQSEFGGQIEVSPPWAE